MTSVRKSCQEANPEILITRKQLCARWSCCEMTLKRREVAGALRAVRFNQRMLRYRLSDVLRIEAEAADVR
jgi:hypothetical protein